MASQFDDEYSLPNGARKSGGASSAQSSGQAKAQPGGQANGQASSQSGAQSKAQLGSKPVEGRLSPKPQPASSKPVSRISAAKGGSNGTRQTSPARISSSGSQQFYPETAAAHSTRAQKIETKQIDPNQFHPKRIEHKHSPAPSPSLEAAASQTWHGDLSASVMKLRWLRSWPMVVLIVFGLLGTVGATAMVSLFRIPNLPNCRAIFWPTASASMRLQCAESYAQQGDVDNLLAAIALVDRLPADHPLRADINQRIENWANQVLDLAERSFEAGDLELAIDTANKIPDRTAAKQLVAERVERWQRIWQEGEKEFSAAVTKVKEKNFQAAFSLSVKLLDVDNKFWSSTKYNELTKLIATARDDSRKLSEALGLAKAGTLEGFKGALKALREIGEDSVFFSEVKSERQKIGKQMLKRGEELLADRQLKDAQAMLNAVPRDVGLNREIEDSQIFVTAYQQAWTNSIAGLENAITRMKALKKNRPSYAKGQQLIAQWQDEINNLSLLAQAQERAQRGSTADLTSAIAIAQQVSTGSPQREEASAQISKWQSRVEAVQDRPVLERADRLAAVGTPDNLRAAIQEAKKIPSGRALGKEADERIANWTERVQRIEDQPILDQARQRAQTGDVAGAIAIANRIGSGRSLYRMAQDDIAGWQAQEDGRARLSEAVNAASRGDGSSLANAIEIAQRVPSSSDSRSQADSRIDQWSWDLLQQAELTANRNIGGAIALAGRIPSGTEAYDSAQVRIGNWQATLNQTEESRRAPAEVSPPPADVNANGVPTRLDLTPAE